MRNWAAYRAQWKERFWNKVDKSEGSSGCWRWLGGRNSAGYGCFRSPEGNVVPHRVAWYLTNGGINLKAPRDSKRSEFVLHKCDNRLCCNPSHLFLGTYADNMKDMYAKNRHPVYRGEEHTNAKLSAEAATEVRRLYAAGFKQTQLALWAGVSQRAISLIVRGETYK